MCVCTVTGQEINKLWSGVQSINSLYIQFNCTMTDLKNCCAKSSDHYM